MSAFVVEENDDKTNHKNNNDPTHERNQYKMLILLEQSSNEQHEDINSSSSSSNNNDEEVEDKSEQPRKEKHHEYITEVEVPLNIGEEYIEELNEWFDQFDEKICIPNEGFIKYEITSDGLIVLLIDESRESLVNEVIEFVK